MMNMLKKYFGFAVKTAFSAAIIWYLLHRSGAGADRFRGLKPAWLLPAACFLLGQNVMTAVRWHFLLRCLDIRLPFRESLS